MSDHVLVCLVWYAGVVVIATIGGLIDLHSDGDCPHATQVECDAAIRAEFARLERSEHSLEIACTESEGLIAEIHALSVPRRSSQGVERQQPSSAPPPQDEIEIDTMLADFQRACETVVVRGDSNLSETMKERAIIRNLLRSKLLRPQPLATASPPDSSEPVAQLSPTTRP